MLEYQSVSSAHLIERPRCPKCHQPRMLLAKIEAGPSGFDYHTFECQNCGRIRTVITSDPMVSDVRGWLDGERKPPA